MLIVLTVASFLFLVGAVLGSFLNVLIYRTVNEESWVGGRSRCDHCRQKIAWYDNIPLVSYVLLGARCRNCQQSIPSSYPVVEFLTGALFVWWYVAGSLFFRLTQAPFQTLQPLFWLVVGVLLLALFFADFLYYLIPDVLVGALFVFTLLYRFFLTLYGQMRIEDLGMAMVGMGVAVAVIGGLWAATKGKGMGFGDVKLVAPLALLVGWPGVWLQLFLAFLSGGLVGILLLATRRKKIGQVIPFGPFLILAACITLVWGDELLTWYWQWLS